MASLDEDAFIARIHDAFADNVKSRSETTKVRQSIAAAVSSYVTYDESGNPVQVKSPEKGISGLRRRYLEALKSNLEARQRYQQMSAPGRTVSSQPQEQAPEANSNIILSHLETLRLQRRHQELDIRRRYAQSLSQDAPTSCNFDIEPTELQNGANGDTFDSEQDDIAATSFRIKAIAAKLQKAVLQANHQLQLQTAFLADMQQQQSSSGAPSGESQARENAIAATRNILVAWLDEKLSEGAAGDFMKSLPQESKGDLFTAPQSVAESYERYIDVRKALMQAANEALRPLHTLPNSVRESEDPEERTQTSEDLEIWHAISQRLNPKQQQQGDATALHVYKCVQVAKEQQHTLEVIKRLADESHLLSTYPSETLDCGDKLSRTVAAWTSAASAATELVVRGVEQHERVAYGALKNVETGLVQLKSYNGDDDPASKTDVSIDWRGMRGHLKNS